MKALRQQDVQWRQGRVFSLVYHVDDELTALLKDAYTLFFSENALNPTVFPSLRKMETEVVAMTASLLGGDERTVGNMTSGGTESLLMAILTARDLPLFIGSLFIVHCFYGTPGVREGRPLLWRQAGARPCGARLAR